MCLIGPPSRAEISSIVDDMHILLISILGLPPQFLVGRHCRCTVFHLDYARITINILIMEPSLIPFRRLPPQDPPAFVMRTVSAKLGRARTYGRIFRQLRTVDVSAVWLSDGAGFRDLRSYAAYADSRPRLDAQSYNVTLWVPRALAFDVLRPGPEAGSGWAGAIPLVDFEGIACPAKGRKDDTGSEEGPQH